MEQFTDKTETEIPELNAVFDPFSGTTSQKDTIKRRETIGDLMTKGPISVFAGAADTIGQSIGLFDDNDITESLKNILPSVGTFYERNREAARTVSDITGMFVPGMLGIRLLNSASKLVRGTEILTGFGKYGDIAQKSLFTSGLKSDKILRSLRGRDLYLARRGELDLAADATRKSMVNQARILRTTDAAKEGIAFEIGVAATMNESDLLFPDEASFGDNVALASLGIVLPVPIELFQVNRLIRSSAQSVSGVAARALNPEQFPLNIASPKTGERDLSLTVSALTASKARQVVKEFDRSGKEIVEKNFDRFDKALRGEQKDQVEKLFREAPLKVQVPGEENALIVGAASVNSGVTQNVLRALEEDPLIALGTKSIQEVDKNTPVREALRIKTIAHLDEQRQAIFNKYKPDETISSKDIAAIREINSKKEFYNSMEEFVIETNGEMRLAANRRPLFQDDANAVSSIKTVPATAGEAKLFTAEDNRLGAVGFNNEGVLITENRVDNLIAGIHPPKGFSLGKRVNSFEGMNFKQRSLVYALMQKNIEKFDISTTKFAVNENSHHTQLDYVRGLHDKFGNSIFDNIKMPDGIRSIDDIEMASLNSKFNEYKNLRELMDAKVEDRVKIGNRESAFSSDEVAMMLNLPISEKGVTHPVLSLFEDIFVEKGLTDFRSALGTMENVQRAMQEIAFFPEVTKFLGKKLSTTGKMLNFNPELKPALLIKSPVSPLLNTRKGFIDETITRRTIALKELSQGSRYGADLVALVTDELNKLDATNVARNVGELSEAGKRGTGAFIQQGFARGEQPVAQAMQAIEQNTDQIFRKTVGKIFNDIPVASTGKTPVTVFTALRNKKNLGDLEAFNLFAHSRRQAWDLTGEVVEKDGKFLYVAEKNKFNKELYKKHFGTDILPEDFYLPAPTTAISGRRIYQPLAITQLAREGVETVSYLGDAVRNNINHLKRVNGRPAISRKNVWMPPKNFSRGDSLFLIDDAGQLANVINGRTLTEAQRIASQEISLAKASNKNLHVVDKKDLEKYFNLQDEAFEKLLDFSDPLNQTGRATGKSIGNVVEIGPNVLDDMVLSVERSFESILRRTRAAYFEPQINQAKQMFNVSRPLGATKGQSIYQQYLASIFGNPTLHPNDVIGKTYFTVESIFDDMLKIMHDKVASVKTPINKTQASAADIRRFNALEKSLNGREHNPFNDALEFAQNTYSLKNPPRLKAGFAALNRVTSLLTLRMFEVGHAVLTLTSLGATMPAVINGMRRHGLETSEQHAARIGAFGKKIDADHAMFSVNRAVSTTIHDIFNDKSFREIWQKAADEGYMDQNVAESFKTLTAPSQGYAESLITKATDIVSTLSDKSETLARGISFMVGYNIARKAIGITEDANRFVFAKRFADETIGNYSPNNRPRIFQGAVGMPLGLFMTFMTNYYQRMFSYVENRDIRAAITQFATQASVFGGSTVPGFEQFASFFASQYDGQINPIDGMRNQFGEDVTEAVLYGALSNLPKLFGADQGIALFTRGDVSLKQIPVIEFEKAAPFQMIKNVFTGISKAIGMLKTQGFDDARIAEIVQQYSTNRTFRNVAAIYNATVNDAPEVINKRGEVINQDVMEEMSLIARGLGLRPTDESTNTALLYRVRSTEFSQRAKMERLRDNIREDLRTGDIKNTVGSYFRNYIRYGGSPSRFPNWLIEQGRIANIDKVTLEFLENLGSENKMYDTIRLMNAVDPQSVENLR